ncbi:MAG: hypothetical protein ABI759_11715 [Candidatus Solibacter sp.]
MRAPLDTSLNVCRPGKHARLGDIAAAYLEESDFDKGEGKVETCVLLKEICHAFYTLPDAIANDQQQESSAFQVSRDGIMERHFINFTRWRNRLVQASPGLLL